MILNWNVSKEDHELIRQIAERAKQVGKRHGVELSWRDLMMDVTACHANGNPLDLAGLLAASVYEFTHDVFGIAAHLDHETGKLEVGGPFVPRYSVRKVS